MNKKIRVWYIDRVPCKKTTYIEVKNENEAVLVIKTLTQRDLNDERITDNAMGLESFEDGEWTEYCNEDGESIDEIIN
jgi:hypothetical protein